MGLHFTLPGSWKCFLCMDGGSEHVMAICLAFVMCFPPVEKQDSQYEIIVQWSKSHPDATWNAGLEFLLERC